MQSKNTPGGQPFDNNNSQANQASKKNVQAQKTPGQQEEHEEGEENLERYIRGEIENGQNRLVLKERKLQDISFLSKIFWDNLIEIDLHKNFLSSIDNLNQYKNLRIIRASNNYVQDISLNLPKLEVLDLQNNYIVNFPLLNQLPKIKELNLNSNKITEIKTDFKPPSSLSLISLDLGNNLLDLSPGDHFNEMQSKFKKLKNLKFVIISNNKNSDDKQLEQIVGVFPSLEKFNNDQVDKYKKHMFENQGKLPAKKDKVSKGQKVDKNTFYFPTLELLVFNLEAANSHPSYALDHLKDLAMDVDKISEHLQLVDEYFRNNKTEQEINELIETFMQNAQLLIDNNFELQTIMLAILSKLSIVKFNDFGIGCFNTLKDLMKAGKEMERSVIAVLEKEVINKLQQQNPEIIPSSLLRGLQDLVNETEKADMLRGLFDNCLPTWLRMMIEKINQMKKIGSNFDNNEHYDAIIGLLAVAVKENKQNVERAIKKQLLPMIADILNNTTREQERYINCLRTVEYISLNSQSVKADNAANIFLMKHVHNNLLNNIKAEIMIYKKNNDLREEESQDTEEKIKMKYLTLAAEIDCLGGILEADRAKRDVIIKQPIIDDLLQITSHYYTDPVLLTSICKFARQLFSRDEMRTNQHLLEPKLKKMQNLIELVPYLGLKKYDEVLKMSRRYYDQQAFAVKEKSTQMLHLDNVVVQDLFIAIVQLINFFCEEAAKSNSVQIFDSVSKSLNDVQREAALFNCLEVPNDEVKLAVVECLNNVPLSEFEPDEIATIIRLLGSYKNIGAGKTEYVLSKIFWMITKLTIDTESEAGNNFRLKFGERAITEALDILIRNQMRLVDDEEEEQEKLALSLSCLHFLKFASTSADLRRYMENRGDLFQRALYAEYANTSYETSKVPVEIEDTQLGMNVEILSQPINPGQESLEPYNYVSFRVIQRLADVLMNKVEMGVMNPFQAGEDVIGTMIEYYKQKLKDRKQLERSYWEDPPEHFIPKLKENPDAYNNYYQQHFVFTWYNKIQLLQMFLTKKVPAYEQYLKKHFDKRFDKKKLKLKSEIMEKKEKSEFEEIERQKDADNKKTMAKKEPNEEEDDFGGEGGRQDNKGLYAFKMNLQKDEIGQDYDPSTLTDNLLQSKKDGAKGAKGKNAKNILKRDFKVGVQNQKMRSLCVAAYLRCLFAAIEYAPDLELQHEAIKILKDDFTFMTITQLCDSTGWLECNIGAKYLRIMQHILQMPFQSGQEAIDNLPQYEMVAIVVQKLLNLLKMKINSEKFSSTQREEGKAEEKKDLMTGISNEDKILIYELAKTCSILCEQCSYFEWSLLEVKEKEKHQRTRRSPQEKCLDLQISSLFPVQNILTFIEIVFRDMNLANKVFENPALGAEFIKEPEFVRMKSNYAREYIKKFLGEYVSKCKDNKYLILEYFMKGMVYEKKRLRESYLQEILKAMGDSLFKAGIEDYMLKKGSTFEPDEKERVNRMSWVELSVEQQVPFKPRLFVCTNRGIYIFRASGQKPCNLCPPEHLCPEGPRLEMKFDYDKMYGLIQYPDQTQKVLIQIKQSQGNIIKKENLISLCIIIPGAMESFEIISYLQEVLNNYHSLNYDAMTTGSILDKIGYKEEIYFSRFISHNPTRVIFGFWTEESVINNCSFVAVSQKQVVILKENWAKWSLIKDQEKIVQIMDKESDYNRMDQQMMSMAQKVADQKIRTAVQAYFQVVAKYDIANIQNLHIHKGRDAVVELQFGKKVEKLIFLCDFSRYQFINALLRAKYGGDPE